MKETKMDREPVKLDVVEGLLFEVDCLNCEEISFRFPYVAETYHESKCNHCGEETIVSISSSGSIRILSKKERNQIAGNVNVDVNSLPCNDPNPSQTRNHSHIIIDKRTKGKYLELEYKCKYEVKYEYNPKAYGDGWMKTGWRLKEHNFSTRINVLS